VDVKVTHVSVLDVDVYGKVTFYGTGVIDGDLTVTGSVHALGDVTAGGTLEGANLQVTGAAVVGGALQAASVAATGDVTAGGFLFGVRQSATSSQSYASGTNAPTLAVAAAWNTRLLNTLSDPQGIFVGAPVLGALTVVSTGTFYVEAQGMALGTGASRLRLFNVTSGAAVLQSLSSQAPDVLLLQGKVSLLAGDVIRLEQYVGIVSLTDGGAATSDGSLETYATLSLTRLM